MTDSSRTATKWLQLSNRTVFYIQNLCKHYFSVEVWMLILYSVFCCVWVPPQHVWSCCFVQLLLVSETTPLLLHFKASTNCSCMFLSGFQSGLTLNVSCRSANLPLLNASLCVSPGKQSGTAVCSELTAGLLFSLSRSFTFGYFFGHRLWSRNNHDEIKGPQFIRLNRLRLREKGSNLQRRLKL